MININVTSTANKPNEYFLFYYLQCFPNKIFAEPSQVNWQPIDILYENFSTVRSGCESSLIGLSEIDD